MEILLGEDVESEHLKKTPARAAKSLVHLTSGNKEQPIDLVNDAIYKNSSKLKKEARKVKCGHLY